MNDCLIVSTYPPRKCGIANFSKDLRDHLIPYQPRILMAAMEDPFQTYDYPVEVVWTIQQENKADYTALAHWVNQEIAVDMIIIQHEYGIFGGPDGEYIVALAEQLKKPFLLVTHTVLPHPSQRQQQVLSRLADLASGVICMTERARSLMLDIYAIKPQQTFVVPHGVPDFRPQDRKVLKEQRGWQNRTIITTFGLIGPGKGLEIGLKALAGVVEKHPRVLYVIAGATHPVLLRNEGERYRENIMQQVRDLKLEEHVIFENRYLTNEELGDYLYLTDIYLSPYPNLDQAVSGTLAFATGTGRAIISTPYEYARELLEGGRGLLAERPDADALAGLLDCLLSNPSLQEELERKTAEMGGSLSWDSVAALYHKISLEILERLGAGQLVLSKEP
ncbi:MAG: glycosyltransferase [Syntrophomonadaceae bacterium]|nr:glycosyltransferase [Syntrophomonadaceae bacterium]